jgi:hypothetical protein
MKESGREKNWSLEAFRQINKGKRVRVDNFPWNRPISAGDNRAISKAGSEAREIRGLADRLQREAEQQG